MKARASEDLINLIHSSMDVLYEDAPCGYIFTLPDGTFIKVNRTFLKWVGFELPEIINVKRFQEILSIGSKIYYETHYGPLLRMQGFLSEVTLDIIGKGDGQTPVLINSEEIRDEENNVLMIKSTLFNISDRRSYEKELLSTRKRAERTAIRLDLLLRTEEELRDYHTDRQTFQRISDIATEGFSDFCIIELVIDGKLRLVAQSHHLSEKLISIPRDPHSAGIGPLFIERINEDAEYPEDLRSIIEQIDPESLIQAPFKRGNELIGVSTFFLTSPGQTFTPEDMELGLKLGLTMSNAIETAQLTSRNKEFQRELYESHEWYSTTLRSIGDAVIAINPDKTVKYLNTIAEELTMWSLQEAIGKHMDEVFNIVHSETGEKAFNPVEKVLREGTVVGLANSTALIRKDGSKIIIEDSAAPIRGDDQIIKGVVLVFRDSTKKHLEEKERMNLLRQLEMEKTVRESISASLTHDLRTPLSSLGLKLQLINRQSNSPTLVERHTQKAMENIKRIDRMIEDILDASRLQIGELLHMDMITMNIVTLVENVLSELRLLHGDHFILISPKEIRGKWNEDGIRRIIENLCNNAIKYGYAHSPITVTLSEANDLEVELSVHNFGDAIPPSKLNKLFELYSRVNTDKHSEKVGWGIGLSIVKGIAEAHQGRVNVSSTTNTGTIFKITLAKHCR